MSTSGLNPPALTARSYRGRLAPSPTGLLHLGHARTFWEAQARARDRGGALVLRNEDLDRARCKPEFVDAMFEDLRWFGFEWDEGPDKGGALGPYSQRERMPLYVSAIEQLRDSGWIYPCMCSRQDVARAAQAPHAGEDEPIYPGTCRPGDSLPYSGRLRPASPNPREGEPSARPINWRFRVPDGQRITFVDNHAGPQAFVSGSDFGDFIVWRHDGIPSYQLAVVVDDAAMRITEVVRGEDLLKSTARQLLLYSALGLSAPSFFHCQLVADAQGVRLAKRHDALSLRALRGQGLTPEQIRRGWNQNLTPISSRQ